MKKIVVAIFAMLYMGVSSGIAMEIHYCMGKKAGIDFYGDQKDKCGKCGMKGKKGGCCNDEHKFIKLNDVYKNVSNELVFGIPDVAVLHSYNIYQVNFQPDAASRAVKNHSPPNYTKPSACILNCVFRL
ncbi:MAG: hypothetical protein ABIQ31_10910 [Ferruginibacter sp.]